MEDKKIRELLENKETMKDLREEGWRRDEIRRLNRAIFHEECEINKITSRIIQRHQITPVDFIGLAIMADVIAQEKEKKQGDKHGDS